MKIIISHHNLPKKTLPANKNKQHENILPDKNDYSGGVHVLSPLPEHVEKMACTGIRRNGDQVLAFSSKNVSFKKAYTGKNNIPCIFVTIKEGVTFEVYGSHMDSENDYLITHVVRNPTKWNVICVEDYGDPPHLFATMLVATDRFGWSVHPGEGTQTRGEAAKTVLQGVVEDQSLPTIFDALDEILENTGDFHEEIPKLMSTRKSEQPVERRRVGEKLLDFLVPAIRGFDLKKIDLLKKCIKFYGDRTRTKVEMFCNALQEACEELERLPSAPELHARIVGGGFELKESRFYSDLADLGLGWLTRKKPSKTPVG